MMHLEQVMDATVYLLDLVIYKSSSLFDNIRFLEHCSGFVHIILIAIYCSEYMYVG